MTKKRRTIPVNKADEVMFRSDLLCCICENRGDQIHHIDSNPDNNEIDNLVLLCFKHHDEVTSQGGLSRRLSPGLLRNYRASLYRKVEARRKLPRMDEILNGTNKINEDTLFQLMLDAVTFTEIQKIRIRFDFDKEEQLLDAIYDLSIYIESSGIRARREILSKLDDIAGRTRFGLSTEIGRSVARVAYDALPIRSLRSPAGTLISESELELLEYGLSIGTSLAYDAALYINNINIVEAGGELLWKILRYARINNYKELLERSMIEFETAEDGARRGGDKYMIALLRLYRQHGLSGDWHYPKYTKDLLKRLD